MEITLYIATSADGFIATNEGDSGWVSEVDAESFENAAKERGAIILGRKTFEQFEGELYPMKDVINYVITSDTTKKSADKSVVFLSGDPKSMIKKIEDDGITQALLVGGSHANTTFIQASLIDKVIISIHPLFLGSGMPIFAGTEMIQRLHFDTAEQMDDGLIKLYYTVNK